MPDEPSDDAMDDAIDDLPSEPDGEPESPRDGHGEVTYEASEWSGQSRAMLSALLSSAGIGHVWQGTAITVDRADEEVVDAYIDEVQATATAGLDPEAAKVVYEVAEWSAAMQTSLADSLAVADIAYEWDENGDLVVYEQDEDAVEVILDAMPDPDDDERDGGTRPDAVGTISRLWEMTSALARDVDDPGSTLAVIRASDDLEHASLPFGIEAADWRTLVQQAVRLRDVLESTDEADHVDDEALVELCVALRDRLRRYI